MPESLVPAVSLGFGVGVAFIVIFSLGFSTNISEEKPIMVLTTADGKTFRASINSYCNEACDLLAYARVIPPDPPVHINKESGVTFRIANSIEQPKAIRLYLPNYKLGVTSGFDEVKADANNTIDLDSGSVHIGCSRNLE